MFNLGIDVLNIINNPMGHGFGAGIQQNTTINTKNSSIQPIIGQKRQTTKSETNSGKKVIVDVTGKKRQIKPQTKTNESLNLKSVLSGNGKQTTDTTKLVDSFLFNAVNTMLNDQIKKGNLLLDDKNIGTTFVVVSSVFKKILDNDKDLITLRNDTTKDLDKAMKQETTNKLNEQMKGKQGQQRKLLNQSKLAGTLNSFISLETVKCVSAILNGNSTSSFSKSLSDSLKYINNIVTTSMIPIIGTNTEKTSKTQTIGLQKNQQLPVQLTNLSNDFTSTQGLVAFAMKGFTIS